MTPRAAIQIAAEMHGLKPEHIIGTGRRKWAVTYARAMAVRMAVSAGASKAEMARALGLDWTSVHNLARKYPHCAPGAKWGRNERGAGCWKHRDASDHSGPEMEARDHGC